MDHPIDLFYKLKPIKIMGDMRHKRLDIYYQAVSSDKTSAC